MDKKVANANSVNGVNNVPSVRSFERLIFVNEETGEAADHPKDGFVPMVVPKYIYQKGLPLQYQIDLKDAIFGQVGEDKANFKPINELVFTPLAVYEFGSVCMYPQKDPVTGQRSCKNRNMVSVIAYIPANPHIVSFLLPTWTASNFLREYKKSGRVSSAGIPVTSTLQLQFKAVKYQETSASGIKVWALKFDVIIMPPKYFKELAEFSEGQHFFALEHFVEVLANNRIDFNNPPLWLRKAKNILGENFEDLLALSAERRYQQTGELEAEDYNDYEIVNHGVAAIEQKAPEVPAEKVAAYLNLLESIFEQLTEKEQRYFSDVQYSIGREEFKEKGFALKKIADELEKGIRKKVPELPF